MKVGHYLEGPKQIQEGCDAAEAPVHGAKQGNAATPRSNNLVGLHSFGVLMCVI
jgi:hypothetical protein